MLLQPEVGVHALFQVTLLAYWHSWDGCLLGPQKLAPRIKSTWWQTQVDLVQNGYLRNSSRT